MLQLVRSAVSHMADVCGFEEEEREFIVLAVDEACANVIRHAYEGRTDGEVRLSCSAGDGQIEFVLADKGRTPRPEVLKPRCPDEVRPGGLGTYLICSVMDKVEYRVGDNGNELYLSKRLRPRERTRTGAVLE